MTTRDHVDDGPRMTRLRRARRLAGAWLLFGALLLALTFITAPIALALGADTRHTTDDGTASPAAAEPTGEEEAEEGAGDAVSGQDQADEAQTDRVEGVTEDDQATPGSAETVDEAVADQPAERDDAIAQAAEPGLDGDAVSDLAEREEIDQLRRRSEGLGSQAPPPPQDQPSGEPGSPPWPGLFLIGPQPRQGSPAPADPPDADPPDADPPDADFHVTVGGSEANTERRWAYEVPDGVPVTITAEAPSIQADGATWKLDDWVVVTGLAHTHAIPGLTNAVPDLGNLPPGVSGATYKATGPDLVLDQLRGRTVAWARYVPDQTATVPHTTPVVVGFEARDIRTNYIMDKDVVLTLVHKGTAGTVPSGAAVALPYMDQVEVSATLIGFVQAPVRGIAGFTFRMKPLNDPKILVSLTVTDPATGQTWQVAPGSTFTVTPGAQVFALYDDLTLQNLLARFSNQPASAPGLPPIITP